MLFLRHILFKPDPKNAQSEILCSKSVYLKRYWCNNGAINYNDIVYKIVNIVEILFNAKEF